MTQETCVKAEKVDIKMKFINVHKNMYSQIKGMKRCP